MTWATALECMNDAVLDTFNTGAIYLGAPIQGIYDENYVDISLGEVPIESSSPAFIARASDVPGVAHGASLIISGATFKVVNVQPDGSGLLLLILEKQ